MKAIPLTQGKFAVVDAADWEKFSDRKWQFDGRYAVGSKGRLHRLIMGAKKGESVDHINGDRLDNRRSNLRICTHQQNMQNRKPHAGSKHGLKGVQLSPGKRSKPWRADIRVNEKRLFLGSFKTEIEAAQAYDDAALKYYGEFARLNASPRQVGK